MGFWFGLSSSINMGLRPDQFGLKNIYSVWILGFIQVSPKQSLLLSKIVFEIHFRNLWLEYICIMSLLPTDSYLEQRMAISSSSPMLSPLSFSSTTDNLSLFNTTFSKPVPPKRLPVFVCSYSKLKQLHLSVLHVYNDLTLLLFCQNQDLGWPVTTRKSCWNNTGLTQMSFYLVPLLRLFFEKRF